MNYEPTTLYRLSHDIWAKQVWNKSLEWRLTILGSSFKNKYGTLLQPAGNATARKSRQKSLHKCIMEISNSKTRFNLYNLLV